MRKIQIVLLGVMLAVLGLCSYPILTALAVDRPSDSLSEEEQSILGSTVQISLFPKDGTYYEQGLGTVVSFKGERLLVTHNHWSSLRNLDRVEFRNAKGQLLMELDQQEFKRLILYTQPGTLILKAPAELKSQTVELKPMEGAREGDVVTVVYWVASDQSQLGVFQAKVHAIVSFEKDVAYELIASNGEKLAHGDSGGGVWLHGRYAGNLWAMENDTRGELLSWMYSQTGYAAQFPSSFFQIMEMGDSISQSDEGARVGKHSEREVP